MSAVAVPAGRGRLPRPVRVGLVAAAIGTYLCAVGMVGRFEQRQVVAGIVTLGRFMLFLVAFGAGYIVARRRRRDEPDASVSAAVGGGAVAGAIAAVGPVILVLLIEGVGLQAIFPALGESLAETLSFQLEPGLGVLILVGAWTALGALGAVFATLPQTIRGPLFVGLVATLGMSLAEPLLRVIMDNLGLITDWLYQAGGLAISGAIIVFLLAFGIALFRSTGAARALLGSESSERPAGAQPLAEGARPREATVGGTTLIVVGGLVAVANALALIAGLGRGFFLGIQAGTAFLAFTGLGLLLGLAGVGAGFGVLQLKPMARTVGLVAASLGAVLSFANVFSLIFGGGVGQAGLFAVAQAALWIVAILAVARIGAAEGGLRADPEAAQRASRVVGILAALAVLALLPPLTGGFISLVLVYVGLYVLLGLGLNIVVGYAGLLDLGYVAFYAVGAYATAILTSSASFLVTSEELRFAESGWTIFWVALPIVVVIAVVIGLLIGAPVLRLRGDYLAIVTLGFGEIVRTLVLSDWLSDWLGGAQGIIQIPPVPPGNWFEDAEGIYYLVLAFSLLAAYVSYRLASSRVGRAWAAMREDESVAEAMGISVIRYKLLAFAMGAAVGCLGGAFFASLTGSIFPATFALLVSINVLAILVLGGMGSIPGVVIGSFVLVGLPELLREFAEFRLLIFGAVLVAIMVLRPEGLLPNVRRRRELHVEQAEEEYYEERVGDERETEPQVAAGVERSPGDAGPREKTP
jgi:branched-chain amino acid transport system permease protein